MSMVLLHLQPSEPVEVVPVAAAAEAASPVQMDNHKDKGEDVIVVDVNGNSGKKKSRYNRFLINVNQIAC